MKKNHKEKVAKLITESLEFKQVGDLLKAESSLNKLLEIEPNNFIALNNLGNINSAKNDSKKAKIFYARAISIKKDYSNAIFNLALINEESGKKDDAVKLYKKAIKYDPENLGFYYNLSRIDQTFFSVNNINHVKKLLENKDCSNFNKSSGFFILAQNQKRKENLKKEFEYLIEAHKFFHYSNEKINNQISFFWIRLMPKIIKKLNFFLKKKPKKKLNQFLLLVCQDQGQLLLKAFYVQEKKQYPTVVKQQ